MTLIKNEKLLIVAQAGRMLAQAARRIGLKPIVIDVFGDSDTESCALESWQIPQLSTDYLMPALADLITRHSLTQVLYGSGLEQHPESLSHLTGRLEVLGNQYGVFIKLQEKNTFFSILSALDIPYPDVSFTQPEFADEWLIKPMFGYGGVGIKRFRQGDNINEAVYWQKFITGTQYSVLFVANGRQAQIVGFNTQWTLNCNEDEEFIFSGIINSCDLKDKEKRNLIEWLTKLVPIFGLRGLNSLDFIHADGCSYVLEINPRPPASMQLYDAGLLSSHVRACQGELTPNLAIQTRRTAYQVIYAEHDLTIPQQFCWPEGVVDIPKAGVLIRKGQPICSIIVHEKNTQLVFAQLAIRQQQLIKNLEGTNQHGIHS